MNVSDWIGFTGVFLLLVAYFLQIFNVIKNSSLFYILLNLAGATLACVASFLINYIPFVVLEMAWTVVSVYTLANYIVRKKQTNG